MQDPEHTEETLELVAASSALWPVSVTAIEKRVSVKRVCI